MSRVEERIEYYNLVRDIPYSLRPNAPDYNCTKKNYLLSLLLGQKGLETRRRVCKFYWEDLPFPDSVIEQAKGIPSYHEFLEVHIPKKDDYIIVDPTWDCLLSPVFPVNEWDGESPTDIAVPAETVYSIERSKKIREKIAQDNSARSIERNADSEVSNNNFYTELNQFLDRVRKDSELNV